MPPKHNDFSELEKDFVNPDRPHLFFKLKLLEILLFNP